MREGEEFNPAAELAYLRAKTRYSQFLAEKAREKLGVRGSSSMSTAGMTVEEIERDTASMNRIRAVWKMIGKRSPSPITLPSGRRWVPKNTATGGRAKRELRPLRAVKK